MLLLVITYSSFSSWNPCCSKTSSLLYTRAWSPHQYQPSVRKWLTYCEWLSPITPRCVPASACESILNLRWLTSALFMEATADLGQRAVTPVWCSDSSHALRKVSRRLIRGTWQLMLSTVKLVLHGPTASTSRIRYLRAHFSLIAAPSSSSCRSTSASLISSEDCSSQSSSPRSHWCLETTCSGHLPASLPCVAAALSVAATHSAKPCAACLALRWQHLRLLR